MNMFSISTLIMFLFAGFCRAEIYVVTHRDNPVESLSANELQDLNLARNQTFTNGEHATIYEGGGDELRSRFIRLALGMRVRQFDAYWARLVFAGRVLPLNYINEEAQLLEHIATNIYAIGYINRPPLSESVKTLIVLND